MTQIAHSTANPGSQSARLGRSRLARGYTKSGAFEASGAILELPRGIQNLYTILIIVYALLIFAASLELSPIVIVCNFIWIFIVSYPIVFYRKGWGLEHPLVLLAILNSVSMVIRQSYSLISGLPYHVALPSFSRAQLDHIYCYALLVQCLALLMVYVGFAVSANIKPLKLGQKRITRTRILTLILGITVIGIIALLLMIAVSGDFTQHLKNIAKGASSRTFAKDVGGIGPLALLVNLIGVAALLSICSKQSRWFVLGICLLALGTLFLTEGRRSAVIYPMILFLYAWAIVNRKTPIFITLLVAALGLFVLAAGSVFRSSNWGNERSVNFSAISKLTPEKVIKKATDEMRERSNASSPIFAIVARVPSEVDHLYGSGYAGYFNLFIPRFFWRDKPRGIDYRCGQTFFGVKWGMPPGSVGQAFWEFHIPGVILVFFLFGVAKRWFYNTLKQNRLTYTSLACYLTGMFYMEPDQNSFRNMIFVFVPMLMCLIAWGGLRIRLGASR